jgi:hypothetical protein
MGTLIMKIYRIYILLLLLLPIILAGQTDSVATGDRSLPLLNGHYFIPTSNFSSPFITTYFKTGIGGGVSVNSIPVYTNDGNILLGTLESENTYVIADVDVQVKAKEWLAVWFRYKAQARIGSSTPTLLAQGVTSETGFEFGWMFDLWRNKKSQLSGTISINNSSVTAIDILEFLDNVINSSDSINTPLLKEKNPLDGGGGIRYAYAFNNMIGAQAFIDAIYGESLLKDNKNVWRFDLGILGNFNFNHSHNIPVGFNLGYLIQKFALFEDQKEENSNSFIFKLAYTGREEYNIGLEFAHINTRSPMIEGTNTMRYLTTTFVMVYYF